MIMLNKPSTANSGYVFGDDAISNYLQRHAEGRLTEEEKRVGVSRKPKLSDVDKQLKVMRNDEYPDENMPND
jgi:hypothetical protein